MKTKFIAPCGMNCAICLGFLRGKTGVTGAGHQIEYAVKTAQFVHVYTGKESTVLVVIPSRAKRHLLLDSRYRKNYRMSMIEKLTTIKLHGIHKFLLTEKNRWTCSKCGGIICVHRGLCYHGGKRKYNAFF